MIETQNKEFVIFPLDDRYFDNSKLDQYLNDGFAMFETIYVDGMPFYLKLVKVVDT